MRRSSNPRMKCTVRGTVAAAFSLLVVLSLISTPAAAQSYCAEWVDRLLDTTDNCVNEPFRERAHAVETFAWKGHDYMVFNAGNELWLYNVDNPASPYLAAESSFNFGTVGDSDYDLLRFDVADESRFLVMAHKVKRTVVVDLGSGGTPIFGFRSYYDATDTKMGGFVFNKGSQNYLLAAGLPDGCSGTGLYAVNSPDNLDLLSCIDVGGAPVIIRGLQLYKTPSGALFLYTGVSGGVTHIFEAVGSGAGLTLEHKSSPAGMHALRYELSIDANNARAASSDYENSVVRIWDLSNPGFPVEDYSIPFQAGTVSLRSPSAGATATLFGVNDGVPLTTRTWEVGPTSAQEFETTFWSNPSLAHNDLPVCAFPVGGALSPDGSALYLSRYATHDVFDLSSCLNPVPPTAIASITPDPVFPGRTVTVRDASTGSVDRWAVWVTREPGGTVVAGNTNPNVTNPATITYTIPQNLPTTDSYTGHVAVETDDFSYPDDADSVARTINIDRTPEAGFTISPSAVVVGDDVTLSATAEGVVAASGYEWVIDGPATAPVSRNGQTVTHTIPPNEGGTWQFKLTVQYNHGASGITNPGGGIRYGDLDSDGKYEYEVIKSLDVSSVAADFFWAPSNPLHTQQITLDASTSRPSSGLTYIWNVASPTHTYNGCAAATIQCVIPPESLDPDSLYSVTLTVWNGGDSSTKTKQMYVGNGSIQPVISPSTSSPDIGETVLFSITGVPADVDSASWTMGGPGCDAADSTPECTPSLWNNCKSQSYKYSSSGSKTVNLTIEVGANTFTAPPLTITVQPSGSCGGSTPAPCEYTLPVSSAEFGPNGGTKSFQVQTTSECSWVANTTTPWITILSPSGQETGYGSVSFRVAANDGPYRTGNILVGGRAFVVNQQAPFVPANFTMSNPFPEKGETVTFSVDPILQVVSWDFGQADCHGNSPQINCGFLPPGACNTYQWTYPTAGEKSVTMVLSDNRTQTKHPNVKNTGECCLAAGKPDASFEMSTDQAYTGETVYFTDTSAKSAPATKALGITWSPTVPEIGQQVNFGIVGVTGDVRADWDFGGPGCDGVDQTQTCIPLFGNSCHDFSHVYSSSGDKAVSVTVTVDGEVIGTATNTVTVANVGSCEGGSSCNYSLSDTFEQYDSGGGSGSFNVTTGTECEWQATTTANWIDITSGSGTGNGTVTYEVDVNESTNVRSGSIHVATKTHTVRQEGDQSAFAPTAWLWTITRIEDGEGEPVDEDVYTSSDQHTSYTFAEPGLYRVRLTAANCFGEDYRVDYVEVLEAPVEDFVVGAAVSLAGANDTHWESDFRFFNPCGENLDVRIEYQPENTNNAGVELVFREFQLLPNETRIFPHITDAIPGLEGTTISGSVRIESQSDSGCKVLSVSRTFNDTPDGSLGLFVPALPVKRVGLSYLDLNGLISNVEYRTNLRLVNYSDDEVWVPLTAYDKNGEQIGERREAKVRSQSTKQINEIADWLGVTEDAAPFSVRAEIAGLDVQAFGTVVDNSTGDSVLYLSSFQNENRIWLVGVASLSGVNESQWRTDLWLYNPTVDWLNGEVEFVVGDNPSDSYGFEWPALGEHRTKQYLDIVSDELGLSETRGYIVLTGADGGPAPQVAARTYNLDPFGGTYGLNLRAYGSKDLLQPGETGYIAGISNSSDQSVGFRTNFGVLNTDRNGWTTVRITMYNLDGSQAADADEITIAPGKLRQFDVFRRLGLDGNDMTGSLVVEAVSGGAIAVYVTEIDNRTQDSIFIPAQRLHMGLAR